MYLDENNVSSSVSKKINVKNLKTCITYLDKDTVY